MRQAVQKSACGDNHGAGLDGAAVTQLNAGDAAILNSKRHHLGLFDPKVGLRFQNLAHTDAVHLLIHLRARRPDGRAAAGVEQPELDADRVAESAHDAAKGVDLAHQVAFGDASDGGVARHLRHQVEVHGDHGGAETHAGRGARRFAPGVAGADDHDVVPLVHCYDCTEMKILVLGGGGREHALAWKLAQSPGVSVFAAPGNPGIAKVGTCLPVVAGASYLDIAEAIGADLTVVGPEAPLVTGVVDTFRARGRKIVGPDRNAAQLEGSKVFAKNFFVQSHIATAEFTTVENQDRKSTRLNSSHLVISYAVFCL